MAPTVVLVVGMAGTGKTCVMQRLYSELEDSGKNILAINLDPAVLSVPFPCAIDIRDTINYKSVMTEYKLGPNGAILTCLNLFVTKFDQVLDAICEMPDLDYVLIDTPGQIEVFTWSASGRIITEGCASTFPTGILYVVDTPRCTIPATFMSNMLYAVSILYKSKLPLIVTFNKIDEQDHEFAVDWMTDFESLQEALVSQQNEESYMTSFVNSLSLILEEFYSTLNMTGVSALTGEGFENFETHLQAITKDYNENYLPSLEKKKEKIKMDRSAEKLQNLVKSIDDLKISTTTATVKSQSSSAITSTEKVQ